MLTSKHPYEKQQDPQDGHAMGTPWHQMTMRTPPEFPGQNRSYKTRRRLTWHGTMPNLSEADGE